MKIINEIILPFIKTILTKLCFVAKLLLSQNEHLLEGGVRQGHPQHGELDQLDVRQEGFQNQHCSDETREKREREMKYRGGRKCVRLFWGKTEEMWKKWEGRRGWRRKKAKWEKLRISRNKTSLRMSPTLLWTFDWATLGLRRHLWSTTTSTRCGMRNSELRFVIKAEKCACPIINNVLHKQSHIQVCHRADILEFDVRDKDHAYTEEIGKVIEEKRFKFKLTFKSDWR